MVLIHFPIALFIAGVAIDFWVQWTGKKALALVAYTNLFLAAVMTIPVVATGLIAWRWALEGQRLKGILLAHLVLGCASSLLIWMVWFVHFRWRGRLPAYRLVIEAVAVGVVVVTGHLGGFLSGVNVAQ